MTLSLSLTSNLIGQDTSTHSKRSDNESFGYWFLPHEIKYGGLTDFKKHYSQFYGSYYIYGIQTKTEDGTKNHLSLGVSYSRIFKKDFVSLFPYYGKTSWWGGHYGFKAEPLLNLANGQFEYTNLEFTFGVIASISLCAGVPNNSAKNPFYAGFKIGYGIPFPAILKE